MGQCCSGRDRTMEVSTNARRKNTERVVDKKKNSEENSQDYNHDSIQMDEEENIDDDNNNDHTAYSNNNNNSYDDDDDDGGELVDNSHTEHSIQKNNNGNDDSSSIDKEGVYSNWRDALLDGNTALLEWYAQEHPKLNLINYEFEDGCSSLTKAIQCKLFAAAFCLISKGADVHHLNEKTGNTPIHEAVLADNAKLVAFLVKEKHVDVMIRNSEGQTPFDIASEYNNMDLIELLEPEPVAVVVQSTKPKTALEELSELVGEPIIASEEKTKDTLDRDNSPNLVIQKSVTDFSKGNSNRKESSDNPINRSVTDPTSHTNGSNDKKNDNPTNGESEKDTKSFAGNKGYYEQLQRSVQPKVGAHNPFNRRLKRKSTRVVLEQMEKIQQEQAKLPILEAFLEKKQPRAPYSWQKRWVVVKHGHLLWSDKQREIADATNEQERNKFNGQVALMHIVEWGPIEAKSNKFYLVANTDKKKKRRFEFKALSEQDRDFWLNGVASHIKYEKSMIEYLEQNS